MQPSLSPNNYISWKAYALAAVASILTLAAKSIISIVTRFLNQGKIKSEVIRNRAEAEKIDEETRALELENDIRSGDAAIKLLARLVESTDRAERYKVENENLKRENKELNAKNKLLLAEKRLAENQLDRVISIGIDKPKEIG